VHIAGHVTLGAEPPPGTLPSLRLRVGRRIIPLELKLPTGAKHSPLIHHFETSFRTKPGLKLVRVEAGTERGSWHEIGRRLICAFPESPPHLYTEWIEADAILNPPATPPAHGPLISIILPVFDPPERWLRRAIASVREQSYSNWELCIADDASTLSRVAPLLEAEAAADSRIKLISLPSNGHISAASNAALSLATGTFTCFLDHDDELAPHALAEIERALAARPGTRLIYTDEDKIDPRGKRSAPYFKPDWNPDLLLAQNYFCHLVAYETALLRELGGFRIGCEGAQDWDLALRATALLPASAIVHLPRILYHWRSIPGSTALKQSTKPYVQSAGRRVLADYLARTGIQADILPVRGGHWRLRRHLPAKPPRVSIIIPTRDRLSLLKPCVESILKRTRYPDFEIIIIDNGSEQASTLAYLEKLRARGIKVLRDTAPFNYSALNNRAVAHATGEVLGFLNNDLTVINSGWLAEMVTQALRPEVGAVGAMLYYPDERVQHAGVVLGIGGFQLGQGVACHAFRFSNAKKTSFGNRLRLVQNYSAVTGACLLVRRPLFEQLGGFDAEHFAVAYNDVDFCLRLGVAGYRNVWTPFAELYHHESASRGPDDTPAKMAVYKREFAHMRATWGPLLDADPAYNPNLTLTRADFSPSLPPRTLPPRSVHTPRRG
jgi:GT2 family glycosyltransferase